MKIQVGDKSLTINKWKGKTKKDFLRLLNAEESNEQAVMVTLVYSCIDEDVVLSTDEFRYVLSRIRAISLGEGIEFEFYCDECKEVFKQTLELKDIIRFKYKKLKEIKVEKTRIKLGDIKNKKVYLEKIEEDPDYDFLFRIEKINGNDAFKLTDLEEIIDNLDLNVLEEVMRIYEEHRFKIDDINEVECPLCNHKMTFKFDELPGFFPETWFE